MTEDAIAPTANTRSDTGPKTLAIDVGGTGLKVDVLDDTGRMMAPRDRVDTPYPFTPDILIDSVAAMIRHMPDFDRISLGFPGFVRSGKVLTAPEFDTEDWADFPLADALTRRFRKPARILNDAEVQGYGVISGQGLELVLTLGTGAGTALYRDGELMPHIELAHHVIHKNMTYNEYVGDHARRKLGVKRWSRRVNRTIRILFDLLRYDRIYVGGGNAQRARDLPEEVIVVSNDAGLTGGLRLWTGAPAPNRGRFPA